MEWLVNSWLSSRRLSLLKVVEGSATQCIPGVGQWPSHMPAMGKLQRVAMVQTPMVEPPDLNMASSMALESRKQNRHQNRHQTYNLQNGGRFNCEKETYLQRIHGIFGISLKRHQRWRLLLWHWSKANNTSRNLSVSSGGRTTSHWPSIAGSPIKEGAMVTDERDDKPEDMTVTDRVVVIAVVVEAWDIMKTTKKSTTAWSITDIQISSPVRSSPQTENNGCTDRHQNAWQMCWCPPDPNTWVHICPPSTQDMHIPLEHTDVWGA